MTISVEQELERRDQTTFNPGVCNELLSYKFSLERMVSQRLMVSIGEVSHILDPIMFSQLNLLSSHQTVDSILFAALNVFIASHTSQCNFIIPVERLVPKAEFIKYEGEITYVPIVCSIQNNDIASILFEKYSVLLRAELNLKEIAILQDVEILPICFSFYNQSSNIMPCDGLNRLAKLKFTFIQSATQLTLKVHYLKGYFTEETIKVFVSHFFSILQELIINPMIRIEEINLVNQQEQNKILESSRFNEHKIVVKDVLDLLLDHCVKRPSEIAVVSGAQQLTYEELNQKSDKLMQVLTSEGIIKGDIIAIHLPRNLYYPIVVITLLKMQITFMPIDERQPDEYVSFILKHTGAKGVLSMDGDGMLKLRKTGITPVTIPDNIAYIMYTSGSTGCPKGVMVSRKALNHFLAGFLGKVTLTTEDHCLHLASIGFSSSIRQLLTPLVTGAKLFLPEEESKNIITLFTYIKNHKISIIHVTPSFFKTLIMMVRIHCVIHNRDSHLLINSLRLVISASEPLMYDTVKDWWLDLKQASTVINMYGQTETSGVISAYSIDSAIIPERKVVPLGKPLHNSKVLIVDKNQKICPIGVVGEIIVGGESLSAGYVDNHVLTNQAFVSHNILTSIDQWFHTGDLGFMLPSGDIEFVARNDDQVKIRGIRVDLLDINYAIRQHPSIRDVHVLTGEDANQDMIIIAFIMPKCSYGETNIQLKDYLLHKLPNSMIPSYFIYLDEFPVTKNGKIDKERLMHYFAEFQKRTTYKFFLPETESQKILFQLWKNILGHADFGIKENFFDVGGHSLLALRLIGRLRSDYHLPLLPKDLVNHNSIELLAQLLDKIDQ